MKTYNNNKYTHEHNDHCGHKGTFHNHTHSITNKYRLVLTICFNIIITVAEYIGGLLSGSLALLSDAGHNFSDVLSLMLGYAGERVSEKNPDKKYSFGLKRFEVLIALINALSLVGIGIYIVYEAIIRFLNPVPVNISIMIPVAGIGLLGNVFSIIVLSKTRDSNINMRAAFLHLLYDAISSAAVIIAGIIMYFTNIVWIDLVISLVIVLMIVWSSSEIIRESLRIFMQGTPAGIDSDEVYKNIERINGVQNIHGLHIWSINSSEIFLSCHILTDETEDGTDSDRIIKNVNSMLEKKYGISHTTIQIENKIICSNEEGRCCR
ncbi:MAG: cation transporter [Spirochaetes bacterium]|nr:cation transporter [Spirochaetota bacterium]